VGWTGPRIALLIVVIAAAVCAFIRNREYRGVWLLYFIVAEIVLFSISRTASGANYEARYMSGFFPFFLAALTYGFCTLRRPFWRPAPAEDGALDRGCVLRCRPRRMPVSRVLADPVDRAPAPYYDLIRGRIRICRRARRFWSTLVRAVERAQAHPTTNVFFTFTVRRTAGGLHQEPWRDTAKDFFARFPDAAYLEVAKSYWQVPEIGPWEWPRQYLRATWRSRTRPGSNSGISAGESR